MTRAPVVALALVVSALGAAGLGAWFATAPARTSRAPAAGQEKREDLGIPSGVVIDFEDVAAESGVRFQHFDGRDERHYIMETFSPGLAWLDYDGDGLMDLFLVQGSRFVGPPPSPPPSSKLFRNEGKGRFRDVTEALGVGHVGCGQGTAVGDIDNDGDPDLFVTCYGKPNALYRNEGGRRFVEIADRAGLAAPALGRSGPNWSTCAAFLDYDGDSFLDLFVGSYVEVDLAHYPDCRSPSGAQRSVCGPKEFKPSVCSLYRNRGDGTFADVSHEAGVDLREAKALGVVTLDLDDDGRTDVFVANDEVPNFLFRNLGGGRFESLGALSGCALNSEGAALASMGVDADDLDGDGRPDLYVTAFARESDALFRNEGGCQFLDVTHGSGLGPASWPGLAFGTCFLDVDHDGALDIFVANGHVDSGIDERGDPRNTFRQRAQLYRNDGRGFFRDVSARAGSYFQQARVGRGVGSCDYDNDGRTDLAVGNSGEPTALLHNRSRAPGHWVRITLQGTTSNRDAVGARVALQLPDGRRITRHRKGGGSYLSASDPRLLVGIGSARRVEEVEIRWPSGLVQRLGPLDADRGYRIVEGSDRIEPGP